MLNEDHNLAPHPHRRMSYFLVNLFLIKLVGIYGFSALFLAIAIFSAHFPREL